jgi:hypothetical protein
VLVVEEGSGNGGDEELRSIGVGPGILSTVSTSEDKQSGSETYSHGEKTRLVMLESEVFILKRLEAPDTC